MKAVTFGPIVLPLADHEHQIQPGYRSGLVPVTRGDGSLDTLSGRPALKSAFAIDLTGMITVNAINALDQARDVLYAAAAIGLGVLEVQMRDAATRWTPARLIDSAVAVNPRYLQHIPVRLRFEGPDPYWYQWQHQAHQQHWDGALLWNGGATWGGTGMPTIAANAATTITNNGNRASRKLVAEFTGPWVNPRLHNARNHYECRWTGTIALGERLRIDVPKLSVQRWTPANIPWVDAYAGFGWDTWGPNPPTGAETWMRLEPGANVIEAFGDPGSTGTCTITYAHCWEA